MKLEESTNVPLDAKEYAFILAAVSYAVAKSANYEPREQLSVLMAFAMAVHDLEPGRIKALSERMHAQFKSAWGELYEISPLGESEPATEPVQESAPESPAQEVA